MLPVNNNKQTINSSIANKYKYMYLILLLAILVSVGSLGFVGYTYYVAHIYDSSTAKTELQDFTPPQPPQDIQKNIRKLETQQVPPINKIPNQNNFKTTIYSTTVSSISASIDVPIVMYHYVEYVQDKKDKTRIALDTPPFILENEIQSLIANGYTFMTNSELADVLDGKMELPPKPILLTFDDGYRDFYTDAYPILKKYHIKATNYVISGFLNRPNHLLTSQLQDIARDGLVEIGAHTVDHVWLKGLDLKTVSDEAFQSREMLENLIHKPVVSFAYPFGAFDDQAIQVVKDAGFRTAVSTLPGVNQSQVNRFYMFRLRPGDLEGQAFINLVSQKLFRL